jgi:hypothetical protein
MLNGISHYIISTIPNNLGTVEYILIKPKGILPCDLNQYPKINIFFSDKFILIFLHKNFL